MKIGQFINIVTAMSFRWNIDPMKTMKPCEMKVNSTQCKTCPFNKDGDLSVKQNVTSKLMESSQMCHGTGYKTLCRGARDHQLMILHRIGFLSEPTDEAWKEKWDEVNRK